MARSFVSGRTGTARPCCGISACCRRGDAEDSVDQPPRLKDGVRPGSRTRSPAIYPPASGCRPSICVGRNVERAFKDRIEAGCIKTDKSASELVRLHLRKFETLERLNDLP